MGSCAVVIDREVAVADGNCAANAVSCDIKTMLGAAEYSLTVGSYLIAETTLQYLLVTKITMTAQATATIGVIRTAKPPCTSPNAAAGNHAQIDDGKKLYLVSSGGCYAVPKTTSIAVPGGGMTAAATTVTLAGVASDVATAFEDVSIQVGGYILIDDEYMLVTDIDTNTLTVERGVAPPCVIGTTKVTSTAAAHTAGANKVFVLTLPGSANMISTSMRAIAELSPREEIVWAPVAPALPPSAFYVDVKVGIEYSEAEFATKSAAFTRAMSALTGVAVESTMVSYSAARRASGNVNARSYVLSQAEVTALLKKLGTDTDTCTCGSSCQKALLDGLNEKLVAEGLKPATSAEIVFNEFCKPKKKSDDNLLLLLLLLLLIPIGAA